MKSLRHAALGALGAAIVSSVFSCATAGVAKPPPPSVAAPENAVAAPKVVTPEEMFADGVKAFDAGQFSEAEGAFGKALAKQPQMVSAQYNLGVLAEREGELGKAQSAYEAAHQMDPAHVPTMLNLGRVYRLQDKFEPAISMYEKALKLQGHEYDVALLNNLTVAYRLAKKFDLAEATARRVLARTKDNPDAYKNLALIYYDQGNYRLAEFISANAKKLDDKDPGVYNNLGMIYLKLDERRLALGQFQKAVSLNDKFAPGHMNIGAMALSYRDYASAEKAFARAVALDPNSYEGHLAYAYALDGQKAKDPKKGLAAGAEFEKVLAIKADHPDAICGAGWAYSADKTGWDKALAFLEKCKAQPQLAAADQQQIDSKLKSIAAMQKSGAQRPVADAPKEKPKANANGAALLDKVSDEAAKKEGTDPNTPAPAPTPASGEDSAPPAQTPTAAPGAQ